MKFKTWCILALLMFPLYGGVNAEYSVTKVIEIGAGRPAVASTLKWAPDGSRVAFFSGCNLVVSDTLGKRKEIADLIYTPFHYEWLNDREIVVSLYDRRPELTDFKQLVIVDVRTSDVQVIEEYTRRQRPPHDIDANSFGNLGISIEGNLYYKTNVVQRSSLKTPQIAKFPASQYPDSSKQPAPGKNHFLSCGDHSLYLVRGDLLDSTEIAPKPDNYIPMPVVLSPNQSRYMFRWHIYNLDDLSQTSLLDYIGEYPPQTELCDFMDYAFNPDPSATEVIANLIFFGAESHEVIRVAVFDYTANNMTFIDDAAGIEGCELPAYAPDGRKIALVSAGKVYIVFREVI